MAAPGQAALPSTGKDGRGNAQPRKAAAPARFPGACLHPAGSRSEADLPWQQDGLFGGIAQGRFATAELKPGFQLAPEGELQAEPHGVAAGADIGGGMGKPEPVGAEAETDFGLRALFEGHGTRPRKTGGGLLRPEEILHAIAVGTHPGSCRAAGAVRDHPCRDGMGDQGIGTQCQLEPAGAAVDVQDFPRDEGRCRIM